MPHQFDVIKGAAPDAGVARDKAGNLYHPTTTGGNLSCGGGAGLGVVFRMDKANAIKVLHTLMARTGAIPQQRWCWTRRATFTASRASQQRLRDIRKGHSASTAVRKPITDSCPERGIKQLLHRSGGSCLHESNQSKDKLCKP